MKNQNGLTLIELMISLSIGLFIISTLTAVFLNVQNHFNWLSSLINVNDNARFATELLNRDLHQAGYIGCAKMTVDFPIINLFPYEINFHNKLIIKDNIISVRHASIEFANLLRSKYNNRFLEVTSKPAFAPNQILLISDCKKAEIFKVEKVFVDKNKQTLWLKIPLKGNYDKTAEISQFEFNTYFIDKTNRLDKGRSIYALYKKDVRGQKSELVEGIEEMHIYSDINQHNVFIELDLRDHNIKKKWYAYVGFDE